MTLRTTLSALSVASVLLAGGCVVEKVLVPGRVFPVVGSVGGGSVYVHGPSTQVWRVDGMVRAVPLTGAECPWRVALGMEWEEKSLILAVCGDETAVGYRVLEHDLSEVDVAELDGLASAPVGGGWSLLLDHREANGYCPDAVCRGGLGAMGASFRLEEGGGLGADSSRVFLHPAEGGGVEVKGSLSDVVLWDGSLVIGFADQPFLILFDGVRHEVVGIPDQCFNSPESRRRLGVADIGAKGNRLYVATTRGLLALTQDRRWLGDVNEREATTVVERRGAGVWVGTPRGLVATSLMLRQCSAGPQSR